MVDAPHHRRTQRTTPPCSATHTLTVHTRWLADCWGVIVRAGASLCDCACWLAAGASLCVQARHHTSAAHTRSPHITTHTCHPFRYLLSDYQTLFVRPVFRTCLFLLTRLRTCLFFKPTSAVDAEHSGRRAQWMDARDWRMGWWCVTGAWDGTVVAWA